MASNLRAVGSVSISNDRILGAISTSAGAISGSSNTQSTPFAALGAPVDLETAPYVVVDEETHGETDIRFEGVDALRVQAVAQDGCVGRRLDIDARDASAGERSLGRPALTRRAEFARALRIRRRHVKARRPAAIAHEKRAALFEATEQVHDRYAFTNPVARLHDESRGLSWKGQRPGAKWSAALVS